MYLFVRIEWFFNWTNLNPLHATKDALWQVWFKLAHWFWRRIFFNFVNVFLLFCYYIHLEKARTLHLYKLESPSSKDASCQVSLKLVQWFWRSRFLKFVNVFSQFCNYLPLEKRGPFIWNNLNPLYSKKNCAKFGWDWPGVSGKEDF